MKYLLKMLSMVIVISMLMLITSIPVAAEESNVNAELDARDRQNEYELINNSSSIALTSISYEWTITTHVVFSYVRYESQDDLDQVLCVIASQCTVDLTTIVRGDSYRIYANGIEINDPFQVSKDEEIVYKSQHYNSNARAGYVFLNYNYWPARDYIFAITIAPPNGQGEITILTPTPEYPFQCM